MNSSHPLPGWEASDPRPLVSAPGFVGLDTPQAADLADHSISANPELLEAAREVYEGLGRIGELPGNCKCGQTFKGLPTEFKVSMIVNKGDGADPEIITLCRECYVCSGAPAPMPEDDHETKVARFMVEQGATQVEIASALGLSQSKVCRLLKGHKVNGRLV